MESIVYNEDCMIKAKRTLNEEQRKKISDKLKLAHSEHRHAGAFQAGNKLNGFVGKQHTEEWKKERSEYMKQNNPMRSAESITAMMETKIKRGSRGSCAGEKSGNWKGGRPKYRGADWHKQRSLAMERDHYQCRVCGITQDSLGKELTVHHVLPYHDGGTNDLDNLLTVCMSCHFTLEPRKQDTRWANYRKRKSVENGNINC